MNSISAIEAPMEFLRQGISSKSPWSDITEPKKEKKPGSVSVDPLLLAARALMAHSYRI